MKIWKHPVITLLSSSQISSSIKANAYSCVYCFLK